MLLHAFLLRCRSYFATVVEKCLCLQSALVRQRIVKSYRDAVNMIKESDVNSQWSCIEPSPRGANISRSCHSQLGPGPQLFLGSGAQEEMHSAHSHFEHQPLSKLWQGEAGASG